MKHDEEMAHCNLANFADELEEVYKIKDDAPDLKIEDIIDDYAVDMIDLHDSDESGADLQIEDLSLDDLEEDAIPDDPLNQQNSIFNFEFIGSVPKNSIPATIEIPSKATNITSAA